MTRFTLSAVFIVSLAGPAVAGGGEALLTIDSMSRFSSVYCDLSGCLGASDSDFAEFTFTKGAFLVPGPPISAACEFVNDNCAATFGVSEQVESTLLEVGPITSFSVSIANGCGILPRCAGGAEVSTSTKGAGGVTAGGGAESTVAVLFTLHESAHLEVSFAYQLYGEVDGNLDNALARARATRTLIGPGVADVLPVAITLAAPSQESVDEVQVLDLPRARAGAYEVSVNPDSIIGAVLGGGSIAEASARAATHITITVQAGALACKDQPADFNNDGVVDTVDLLELLNVWGVCAGCPQDLSEDDAVDTTDLLEVLGNWGPCE